MSYRDELEAAKQRIERLEESLAAEKAKHETPPAKHAPSPVRPAKPPPPSDAPWDGPFFGTPFSLGKGGRVGNAAPAYAAGVAAAAVAASSLLLIGDITNVATGVVAPFVIFALTPSYYGASRLVAPGMPIRARDEANQVYWFTIAKKPALIRLAIGLAMPWTVAIVATLIS